MTKMILKLQNKFGRFIHFNLNVYLKATLIKTAVVLVNGQIHRLGEWN